ncbi:hypothetical protein Kpol_1014p1 [Vanderwaltozyma polyspora DSM 70294]|uniref:Signal peptidase complex subunit 2 n=1 Tax=Vanderwaltozyma polyspora (strain ATCC 22028 / DSM 70294 / BCRC 21397 / CBS 2163 / NBRC 10782 / NRRL Y-8283 / UCD 57-17) TaxID=436907 RepID=A7TND3_VANPO|nr:uncharacterized protein Kpol_1014p1 [Vanderwaltozyma polyspora DSM 70294]EDO16186.1 hypothetical protein Kpol_1014p1 [Vanderwaltozyma polyspora DSM 70294]
MSKPINVYSIPELRQTLDEALSPTLKRLGYIESHHLTDLKLAIGYSITLTAATSFYLDKKFSYSESLVYQKILVAAYFILSVIFWWFNKFIQNDISYVGENKNKKEKLVLKTKFIDNDPIYKINIHLNDKIVDTELPVNKVFNEAGYLQSNLFYDWLNQQLNSFTSKSE